MVKLRTRTKRRRLHRVLLFHGAPSQAHETRGIYVFFVYSVSNRLYGLAFAVLLIVAGHAMAQNTPPAIGMNTELAGGSRSDDHDSASSVQPAAPAYSTLSNPDVLIGSGDLLEIKVLGVPDYIQQVRVSENGQITLPFIGVLNVAQLSVSQAELLVSKRLADGGFFNDPQVSVSQKEYATQGIAVLGEVQKPGIYPALGRRTLFEAVSSAGGFTQKAGKTAVITHREQPGEPQTVTLGYDAKNSPQSNIPLLPGDTVVVSKAGIVYVVGDVGNPTGVVMENSQLTVLQAIALAQGTKPTAALNKAKLIRKAADGQQEIPLPLKKILSAKAPDVKLQPDDIVFVPGSTAKSIGKRSLEAIVQTATGVAIYRPY